MPRPASGEWVWLESGRVFCPEVEFSSPLPVGSTLKPLRGYAYTLAVFGPAGNCIGWTKIESTGFECVRTWMDAGSPQPE